jgi:hypothetical protein
LFKGIKTADLDVCKMQVMASPYLRDDFDSTAEFYVTFIKQMKAENPQLNVSEVQFRLEEKVKVLLNTVGT